MLDSFLSHIPTMSEQDNEQMLVVIATKSKRAKRTNGKRAKEQRVQVRYLEIDGYKTQFISYDDTKQLKDICKTCKRAKYTKPQQKIIQMYFNQKF